MSVRFLFALVVVCGLSAAAQAATFTVTTTADVHDGICDADCSLRDAITAANALPGQDTVVLRAAVYRLGIPTPQPPGGNDDLVNDEDGNETGDFDIADDLLIRGVKGGTAVDGGRIDRLFEVLAGATAEFRDFEIRNGRVSERGGGLANAGSLRLTRMRLNDNQASSGFNVGDGGAVDNSGTLSIADSQFRNNDAGGGEGSYGEGGAIYNTGRLNIRTTLFTGNRAHDDNDRGIGGAISNRGGFVTIDRSFFQANRTGQHGSGSAISNDGNGRLRVVNSTISGNSAGEPPYGGAIANGTLQDRNIGKVVLHFVTIADNDGGGLFNNGEMEALDSIIGGNYEDYGSDTRDHAGPINCRSLHAFLTAAALMAQDSAGCASGMEIPNEAFMIDILFPLANNGGFAPTHALRYSGNPAIDGARDFENNCPALDQRNAPRPADGNYDGILRCDLGAFERSHDD